MRSLDRFSRFASRGLLVTALAAPLAGCVTQGTYDAVATERDRLQRERDALEDQLTRTRIERDSLEDQFVEAQESYEDERVVRASLASNLARLQERADTLDRDLGNERDAHLRVATELAAREAELASMQSTYDGLVQDLESEVASGQIEIERLREGLRLNVSDDVLFASGSATLDAIGRAVLVKVAAQIQALDDYVEVRGHTDDRRIRGALAKRFPTNWELAAARASRVVRLLESEGVAGDRLAAVSLAANEPIAPNDTANNRALNRRIEIRLLPKEGSIRVETEAGAAPAAPAKANTGATRAPAPAKANTGATRAPAPAKANIGTTRASAPSVSSPPAETRRGAVGAAPPPADPPAVSLEAPEPPPARPVEQPTAPLESTRPG
ncbi:MAG: OmpA family protein [Myxococcota bacterium]